MNFPEKASSFGLSLASRLCSIVNDSPATSVDYVLSEYLLQHYNTLDTLNIYQFAEACRVPRSSIHRFCGKIGYANFSELKLSCPPGSGFLPVFYGAFRKTRLPRSAGT